MIEKQLKGLRTEWSSYLTKALGKFRKDDNADSTDPAASVDPVIAAAQFTDWISSTEAIFQDYVIRIYTDSMNTAAGEIGFASQDDGLYQATAMQYAQDNVASLVTNLHDVTKEMLRSDIAAGMEQGMTPQEIADQQIYDNYAFSKGRSMTIARTETGFTWNHSTLTTYQLAGMQAVTVYDGDGDPECNQAAGQVWSIGYALEHRLEHPNCVRGFGPADPDAQVDRGDDYVDPPKSKTKGNKKK